MACIIADIAQSLVCPDLHCNQDIQSFFKGFYATNKTVLNLGILPVIGIAILHAQLLL